MSAELPTAIERTRLVLVVRSSSARDAVRTVRAAKAGGIQVVEVTATTPEAWSALAEVAADGELTVGAGTITTSGQAEDAIAAGARFLVSPGFSPAVARAAEDAGVPLLPGVLTPTEVMRALELGFSAVKVFPADTVGAGHLRALSGPFPDLRVIPTGGLSAANVGPWLSGGAFAVGVGGALSPKGEVDAHAASAITAAARATVAAVAAAITSSDTTTQRQDQR